MWEQMKKEIRSEVVHSGGMRWKVGQDYRSKELRYMWQWYSSINIRNNAKETSTSCEGLRMELKKKNWDQRRKSWIIEKRYEPSNTRKVRVTVWRNLWGNWGMWLQGSGAMQRQIHRDWEQKKRIWAFKVALGFSE